MSFSDKIYSRLPVWGQNLAITGYGAYWHWLRFGAGYEKSLNGYLARERWSLLEFQNWQTERLKELLKFAITKVPYYRRVFNEKQKNMAFAGQLEKLPLLDKESIRQSPQDFLRNDLKPVPKLIFYTSGSTGTPLASYWTASELRDSIALRETRSAQWAGVSFKSPRATFSGRMVVPQANSKGPFYRFNSIEKQVYFSAFHLSPETAKSYVLALHKHKIEWMTGYAVSYYLLAKFIIDQNLKPPPLKAVITTSEKLTKEMKEIMEVAYQCRVYEEYSTVENSLFASECEKGRLHISPDVAIVEILRPDGSCCELEEPGEVVTTCLMHDFQIFVRYRIGDIAAWDSEPCHCGRQMPVLKEVLGRMEDIVIGSDGRQMVRFHGIFTNQPHVREGQIIQETLKRIRVKIVPSHGFGQSDVLDIQNRMHQRLGSGMEIIVEPVDFIPRTQAGKFKAVISMLDNKALSERRSH